MVLFCVFFVLLTASQVTWSKDGGQDGARTGSPNDPASRQHAYGSPGPSSLSFSTVSATEVPMTFPH